MDLFLKDKVVVVTGGSRGIGRAISHELAKEGATPIIVGKTLDSMEQCAKEIKDFGGKVDFFQAELTDPEQCKSVCEKIKEKYSQVYGLVNNAGVNDAVGLEDGDYEKFVSSLHGNLIHYYLMAHHLLPKIKEQKGAIVNIGSKVSMLGQGNTSGYAASNGGRNALTREWAVDLLPYSVRVNCVLVAECYTHMYQKWINSIPNGEERLAEIKSKIPLDNRMTQPEEIGDMVLFLLSKRSAHTTGQLIFVDGGYTHLDRYLT